MAKTNESLSQTLAQPPVSLVVSVLNESSTVLDLLNAISQQTLLPTEVIIVDGGSTDQTLSLIKVFQNKNRQLNIKFFSLPGNNRSQARNRGISKAHNQIIAITDAGCVPKSDWLEKLTVPFRTDKNAEVVAGFYDSNPKNIWEHLIADFTSTRAWDFQATTFLPSSRSIAFTKKIWQIVGGYPEQLDTCEDLIFAEKLKHIAKSWYGVKDAIVIWEQPRTLSEYTHKIYNYALGDLTAQYDPHIKKIRTALWRIATLFFFAFPFLLIRSSWSLAFGLSWWLLYWVASLIKHRRHLWHPFSWLLAPILHLATDFSLAQAWFTHQFMKTLRSDKS